MLAFIRLLSARQLLLLVDLRLFMRINISNGKRMTYQLESCEQYRKNSSQVMKSNKKQRNKIIFRIEIVYWIYRFYALSRISFPLKCTNCVAISLFFSSSVLQHFTNKSSLDKKKKEKAVYIFQTRDNHIFFLVYFEIPLEKKA